ncbi:hypothetical protein [Rhodoferax antarcticus]|nr:hypothetical protein [Rhodoferax antarcticus]
MSVSGHVFGVTGLNVAACHKGAQDAFAHEGSHCSDGVACDAPDALAQVLALADAFVARG